MPDPTLRDAVLTAGADDPRFLARIAFGIVSPRVMPMRLGREPVFRSMNRDLYITAHSCPVSAVFTSVPKISIYVTSSHIKNSHLRIHYAASSKFCLTSNCYSVLCALLLGSHD